MRRSLAATATVGRQVWMPAGIARRLIIGAALLGTAVPCTAADRLTIVRNGRSAYTIAVEPGASAPIRHGATELQRYIREMSGAELPIVEQTAGARNRAARCIAIVDSDGRSERGEGKRLAPEEYQVRTIGERVEIAGDGRRGALYGCYHFLEDVLGVRWFTPRVTKVPKQRTVTIPSLNVSELPAYEYRDPRFAEACDRDWAVRNRVNGTSQSLDASVGGKVAYGRWAHTFAELVPAERYYRAHPEYFALVDGLRREVPGQLCLTNPDVQRTAIETVRTWVQEQPGALYFSVSQPEASVPCQCEQCRAVEAEEGAASGVVLRFVNLIAGNIARDHPNVLIDTLAYQWSEGPPKRTRPRANVRVRFVPTTACVAHPLNGCDRNRGSLANLKGWSQLTDRLQTWHRAANTANWLQPLPNLDAIAADMRLFRDSRVVGILYQGGEGQDGGSDMAALKAYVIAKLMWNPNRPATPIIQEFLDGVYGKAAPFVRRWIDLTCRDVRQDGVHAFLTDGSGAAYLGADLVEEGTRLFDDAAKAVSGDRVAREEVERARIGLDYVRVMCAGARYAIREDRYELADAAGWQDATRRLVEAMHRFNIQRTHAGEAANAFAARVQQPRPVYRVRTIENASLRVDAVPDLGGRIVRLVDKRTGRNLLHEAAPARDGYPAAGGYEEYPTTKYRAAGWSEPYDAEVVGATGGAPPTEMRLSARLLSGVRLQRTLRLDGDTLRIETVATNEGSAPAAVAVRAHPEFSAPADQAPRVSWRDRSGGSVEAVLVAEEKNIHLRGDSMPSGEWTLHVGDTRLTQRFTPDQVSSALLNGTLGTGRVNLELYGVERTLAPGASTRLDQTWVVTHIPPATAPAP